MKKLIALLVAAGFASVAIAQYTPNSREGQAVNPTETVTENETTIALVGGINEWTAAAAVTNAQVAAPGGEGISVTVINVSTNNIILREGTTIEGAGDSTLGQYDAITLKSIDATAWIEVGTSDN